MTRVRCKIEPKALTNEEGDMIDGVEATCEWCGHATESYGDGEASVRRCLALMNEQCPRGFSNFYIARDD